MEADICREQCWRGVMFAAAAQRHKDGGGHARTKTTRVRSQKKKIRVTSGNRGVAIQKALAGRLATYKQSPLLHSFNFFDPTIVYSPGPSVHDGGWTRPVLNMSRARTICTASDIWVDISLHLTHTC